MQRVEAERRVLGEHRARDAPRRLAALLDRHVVGFALVLGQVKVVTHDLKSKDTASEHLQEGRQQSMEQKDLGRNGQNVVAWSSHSDG